MEVCAAGWLVTGFDVDSYIIAVRIEKEIELSLPYRYFDVYMDGNIGGLVTEFQYGINADIGQFVAVGSGTGFYIDIDVPLGIHKLIEIGFQIDIWSWYWWQAWGYCAIFQYGINSSAGWFVADRLGTCFGEDIDGITLGIDNLLRVVVMASFRFLWHENKMVSIMVFFDVFLVV